MYDWFEPKNTYRCPVCNQGLGIWQSKDTDCMLLHWKEGSRFPTDTDWPDESIENRKEFLESFALPDTFEIYSIDCNCKYPTVLSCDCINNISGNTQIYTGSQKDIELTGSETKQNHKKRMQWLNKRL